MEQSTRQGVQATHLCGIAAVLTAVIVLSLIATGVASHPTSLQSPGNQYLWTDIALLLTYGAAGLWVWLQRAAIVNAAVRVGSVTGVLLGALFVANHVIELFVPVRSFALVIGPVLLTLALLAAAGSATWQRTGSLAQALLGGFWCAVVAVLSGLAVILPLIFIFQERAEAPLKEPFAASGLSDAAAFLMRNSLEAASEALIRMPLFALFLSLAGALASISATRLSRRLALAAAWIALIGLITGTAALWHAQSLERSARPPFVLFGVVLTGLTLAAAHPVWSAYRRAESAPAHRSL